MSLRRTAHRPQGPRSLRLLMAAAATLLAHSALAAPALAPPRELSTLPASRLEGAPARIAPLPLTAAPPPASLIEIATPPLTARGLEGAATAHAPITVSTPPLTAMGRPTSVSQPLRIETRALTATGKRD